MSNAKWTRLFGAFRESALPTVSSTRLKLLNEPDDYPFSTHPELDESGTGIADGPWSPSGPVHYSDIEWVLIPARTMVERWNRDQRREPMVVENPIDSFVAVLEQAGKFEYDVDSEGLRIFGYR